MRFKNWTMRICAFLLMAVVMTTGSASGLQATTQANPQQPKPPEVEKITVEELKTKIARNEPVTIIDVRATDPYIQSDSKIKGAIHLKSRRLQARLAFPPLKDVPRDRMVVTYCACPNEGTSIRAAQVLIANGFKRVRALKGGWDAWIKAGGQVESKPRLM